MAYLTAGLLLVGLVCIFDLLLTFGLIRRLRQRPVDPSAGEPIPESVLATGAVVGRFTTTDTEGRELTQDGLAEGLIVTFLSPGCPACGEILPLVVERAREHGPGRVLAVVVRDDEKDTDPGEYIDRLSPVARVVVTSLGHEVTQAFAVRGLPAYVEMGAEGRVVSSGRALPRGMKTAEVGA
ncbi:hypothetical protein GCM10027176_55270 [Actinoallomurus bryophytorum]|uniref:Thiol-disulfide isomerase/thioredoxin n=1 Tax=Actinoallomurus bryophytorum TaxID=1490222 RepID=A0A543C056_9ACTN|nr:hypothetical protein [Actinoallomurus bryophytorum]TQL90438.1 thiol-disulfide isomerase/thioredoxin [Actinoallomurus bryophytorum]